MTVEREQGDWPGWSKWVLIAVVLASLLTIAATLNDIW
jgi:hypothetical protein